MMWLLYYVMQFLLYVVNALCDVVSPLCYVVFFMKQCHFHFRCQTITQALLILKNRLNQLLERSLGYNGGDAPARLPRSLLSRSHNFALTSISFKDRPFLYDIKGGSLKISLSNGCLLIKCHLFMMICFKLGTDG